MRKVQYYLAFSIGLRLIHLDLTSTNQHGIFDPDLDGVCTINENLGIYIKINIFTLPLGKCYETSPLI